MTPDEMARLAMQPGATLRDAGYRNLVDDSEQARSANAPVVMTQDTHDGTGLNQPVTPGTGEEASRVLTFATPANNNNIQHTPEQQAGGAGEGVTTQGAPPATRDDVNAVEAALQGLLVAKSHDEIKQDFKWQNNKGVAGKGDIKDETLAYSPDIKTFVTVFKGSSILKLIHGLTKYHGRHAPELNGTVMGRIGKWTSFSTPQLVQFPPQKTWDWVKLRVPASTTAFHEFHADPNNRGKLYRVGDLEEMIDIDLPYLCYMPAPGALYASKKACSSAELEKYLGEVAENGEFGLTVEDLALTRTYLVAAGIEVKNENGVYVHGLALAEKAQAVTTDSDGLLKLMQTHMTSYLGQGPHAAKQPTPATPVQHHAAAQMSFQAVPAMMTEFAKQIQGIEKAKTKKETEGVAMTEFTMAALKGFAGVVDEGELPVFYALLKHTKDVGDIRAFIMSSMDKWSNHYGIKIEKNMFLSEATVKNIMAVKPNPMETVATSTSTDLGVSNMVCLPRKTADIETRLMWEQAGRETENNRTLREAAIRLKGETREPPTNFWQVEVMVATTAALLSVLYGEQCPLYINIMKIYDILQENSVQQAKVAFTKLLCKQITWAIYDDMRNFFSKRIMPDAFQSGRGRFPTSYMEDFFSNIMFQNPIVRSTFPLAWLELKLPAQPTGTTPSAPASQQNGGGQLNQRQNPRGGGGNPRGGGPPSFPANPQVDGNFCPQVGMDLKHLHPIIRNALQDYHGLVRTHTFGTIMAKGRVNWRSLPTYDAARNPVTGRDEMCWNYVTGGCVFGDKCKFKICHIPGARFSDRFANDVVRAIKPGVDAIVKEAEDGEPANKKQKNGLSQWGK